MQDESPVAALLDEADRSGVRVLGLRMLTYGAGFATSVLIARALGPEGRGQYALPVAYVAIALLVSHSGLEHANVYLAAQRVALPVLWSNSAAAGLVLGSTAWLVVMGSHLATGGRVLGSVPSLWIAIVMSQLPFLVTTLYWTGLLQLSGRLQSGIAAGAVGSLLTGVASAAFFAADALTPFRALLLLVLGNVATWATLLGLGHRYGLRGAPVSIPALTQALLFGVRAHLALILVFLLLRVDQVIVEEVLGFRALGLYSVAVVLAGGVWLITDPFAAALLPYQLRGEMGDDRKLGFATARLSLLVGTAIGAASWLLAPWFVPWVFGPGFAGAVWPFRFLLPGVIVFAVQRPLAQVLVKEGRLGFVTLFNAIALIVNIVMNFVLLPRIGVSGASLASTAAYIGVSIAYVMATRQPGVAGWKDLRPRRADLTRLRRSLRREP